MSLSVETLALCKDYATKLSLGIENIIVSGTNIILTLKDGSTSIVKIPMPDDGVSITNVNIDINNHLICTLSDNSTVDAGLINVKNGIDGVGISSIIKIGSAGLVDTYQITFTDGTHTDFEITNGGNITKISELVNDCGFVTDTVNNLVNYYVKSDLYNKDEIGELLRNIGAGLSVMVVDELPTTDISLTTIYLVSTAQNAYEQYMYISSAWASLGTTTIDLSAYYTKDEINNKFTAFITADMLVTTLSDYVTTSSLGKVATTNNYEDLDNLPTIPSVPTEATETKAGLMSAQDKTKLNGINLDTMPKIDDTIITNNNVYSASKIENDFAKKSDFDIDKTYVDGELAKKADKVHTHNEYLTTEDIAGFGSGDMKKSVYDKTGNGIVDNAEKVNGFIVGCNVPADAKFTDTRIPISITASEAEPKRLIDIVTEGEYICYNTTTSAFFTDTPVRGLNGFRLSVKYVRSNEQTLNSTSPALRQEFYGYTDMLTSQSKGVFVRYVKWDNTATKWVAGEWEQEYKLPTASATVLGGVKVGRGLEIKNEILQKAFYKGTELFSGSVTNGSNIVLTSSWESYNRVLFHVFVNGYKWCQTVFAASMRSSPTISLVSSLNTFIGIKMINGTTASIVRTDNNTAFTIAIYGDLT